MSVLNWGAPKIEFAVSNNGKPAADANWTQFGDIVKGTTTLTTSQGDKTEAKNEAGEPVDTLYQKSTFSLSFELFKKKGDTKPIEDEDGVIKQNYAVRLTPEDPTCEGFIMYNASVTLEETWSSADGTHWKYTFDALKPATDAGTGRMLQPYTASSSGSGSGSGSGE